MCIQIRETFNISQQMQQQVHNKKLEVGKQNQIKDFSFLLKFLTVVGSASISST